MPFALTVCQGHARTAPNRLTQHLAGMTKAPLQAAGPLLSDRAVRRSDRNKECGYLPERKPAMRLSRSRA